LALLFAGKNNMSGVFLQVGDFPNLALVRSIRLKCKTLGRLVVLGVVFATVPFLRCYAQDICRAPTASNLKVVRLYVARKLEIAEDQVTLKAAAPLRDRDCYTPIEVSTSDGHQPFTVYLSSDSRLLTAEIYDVGSNPAIEAEQRRQQIENVLNEDILLESGNADAKPTVTVFLDLECPYCQRYEQNLQRMLSEDQAGIHVVYRFFPLGIHPWAFSAADSTACVALQNHQDAISLMDLFYLRQKEISLDVINTIIDEFISKHPDLSTSKYRQCISSGAGKKIVESDLSLGQKLGVKATPTTVVDGRIAEGVLDAHTLTLLITPPSKTDVSGVPAKIPAAR
jgi:protein-disulfide isomerase